MLKVILHCRSIASVILIVPGVSELVVVSDNVIESHGVHVIPIKWEIIVFEEFVVVIPNEVIVIKL